MLSRRVTVVGGLTLCAVNIFLIYFYISSDSFFLKTLQNFQKNEFEKLNAELIEQEYFDYKYTELEYPTQGWEDKDITVFAENLTQSWADKDFTIYSENISYSAENYLNIQNYDLINELEYIDYIFGDDHSISFNVTKAYSDTVELKHLMSVCIKAAEAGGIQLRSIRRNFDLKKVWSANASNESKNLVSVGRNRSHEAIEYILKNFFPNIKLVSRENNGLKIKRYKREVEVHNTSTDVLVPLKNILVWFDPLDAENEYQNNFLEYVSTIICVAVEGKPVIGVIHQPFENFTKWGWVGNGVSHYPFETAFEPADVGIPPIAVVSTRRADTVKLHAQIGNSRFLVVAANGAGYKSLQLSEGRANVYLHLSHIKKWKICAGNAILDALSGSMTTLKGKKIDYGDPANVTNTGGIKASISHYDIVHNFGELDADSEL